MVHSPQAAAESRRIESRQPVDASPDIADDSRDSRAIKIPCREFAYRVEAACLDVPAKSRREILELQGIVQLEALAASAYLDGMVTNGVLNAEIASLVHVKQEGFACSEL
jgi:hypothetical protein